MRLDIFCISSVHHCLEICLFLENVELGKPKAMLFSIYLPNNGLKYLRLAQTDLRTDDLCATVLFLY
jgi:hypothetical protein